MAFVEFAQQVVHLDPGQRVQGAERLVGQEEFGLADQGAGEGGALLFAAGQLVRPGAVAALEADLGEGGEAAFPGARAAQAEGDVVDEPEPGQQPGVLEGERDPVGDGEFAGARHRVVEAGDSPQQGRLAGAAAPEQCGELAGRDGEIEFLEDVAVAEAADQFPGTDGGARGEGRRAGGGQPARVRRHDRTFLSTARTAASDAKPKIP